MTTGPVVVGVKHHQHPQVVVYAAAEAVRLGVPLEVVHVGDAPAARELLDEVVLQVELTHPELVVGSSARTGAVVEVLAAAAGEATVVVLGADDGPWVARASGAEIAHEVALVASAPVVVIPRTDISARAASTVVVAIDDAADMEAQLAYGFEAALGRGEPLEVVYAAGTTSDYPGRLTHLARIEDHVDPWRARFPSVAARTCVEGGHPVDACLEAGLRASVLVIGQPTGPHPRLLTRSFGSRILREASGPVAVVPVRQQSLLPTS